MSEEKIGGESRDQILEFFPSALKKALDSYEEFMDKDISSKTPKEFGEHHSAGKIAISHIELLLKLGKRVEIPDDKEGRALAALLEQASAELEQYQEGKGDE